jgi:hypothetical protein
MEDKGADSSSALEASLKAVRDSDIYVGLFGRKYSEVTMSEYREAVKLKKPIFAYVKRARQRDKRVEKFIIEVLKRDFKYFLFGSDTKELTQQLELDLQNFIVDTLRMGIKARAERAGQAIESISREEKNAASYVSSQDPLYGAQNFFDSKTYDEALFLTVAIVEATFKKDLIGKGKSVSSVDTFGDLVTLAQESKLYDDDVMKMLRSLSIQRNLIVHMGKAPEKDQVSHILETARLLIKKLSQSEARNNLAKLWKPFPKINFEVGQWVHRSCKFPQVAWEAYNDSPYQLKVWIEIHPLLGDQDLHPLKDKDINGSNFYDAEPESHVFANGCFTLPSECATSKEELILDIRATVEDVNDPSKSKYKLLPKRWKYIRETNMWSYYPQHPVK